MVIVCIGGFPGTGKSTAAKIYKNTLGNALIISLDDEFDKHADGSMNQLLSEYSVRVQKNVNQRINSELEELKRNGSYDAVIIEGDYAPSLDIWKSCHRSLMIESSFEICFKKCKKDPLSQFLIEVPSLKLLGDRLPDCTFEELLRQEFKSYYDADVKADFKIYNNHNTKFYRQIMALIKPLAKQMQFEKQIPNEIIHL